MKNNNILISVIIPVYNVENYLEECIESVLNQTEQRFELLLIDDGSKDNSGRICDQYAERNQKIKVFHQKNKGVSAARNLGINVANGLYIVFVDADDWVEENYLEILLAYMNAGGMSVCGVAVNEDNIKTQGNCLTLTKEEAELEVFVKNGIDGFPINKMFDRKLIMEHQIFFAEDIAICEDLLFVIQYLEVMCSDVNYIKQKLYHYRILSNGAVNSRFYKVNQINPKILTEFEALRRCKKHLISSKEIARMHCARMVKAAVATLRTLCANEIFECYADMYMEMLKYVRIHAVNYLINRETSWSGKISVFLCAISPSLECFIWKKIHENSSFR